MLFISKTLRKLLHNIEDNSIIASEILYATKNTLKKNNHNYISICSTDSSKLSCLSYESIQKIEKSGSLTQDEYYNHKSRVSVRPGVCIKNILNLDFSDKDIEIFVNLYKAESQIKGKISIIEGEDIKIYYSEGSYISTGVGSLFSSCMRQEHKKDFFNLYTNNQDIVKLVILHDDKNIHKIHARALLWHLDNDIKIMDRIYSNNDDIIIPFLQKWGVDNGYYVRKTQKWNDSLTFITPNNSVESIKIKFKLKKKSFSRYPYLDTFKFYDYMTNEFSNYRDYGNTEIKTMIDVEGGYFNYNYLQYDIIDNCYYKSSDMLYIDYLGGMTKKTSSSNYIYCDLLSHNILFEHLQTLKINDAKINLTFPSSNVLYKMLPEYTKFNYDNIRNIINFILPLDKYFNVTDEEIKEILYSNDISLGINNKIINI